MNAVRENVGSIIICILELLIGIVFFTDPIQFTSIVFMGIGVVMLVEGVWCVVRYFTTPASMAALGQELSKGLIALTVGGVMLLRNDWVLGLFPLFTQIYGIVILLAGIFKLQRGVDLLRLRQRLWGLPAVSAVVAIVLGLTILMDPFEATEVLWRATAILLIAEALLDAVMVILDGRRRGAQDY